MALADLLVRIGVDTAAFSAGLQRFNQEVGKSTREAERQFGNIARAGQSLATVGAGLTASLSLPLAGFAVAATRAFSEIDSLKRGLFTLEKSAEGTERRFRELQAVAALPGLGLEEAVRGDIRLRAIGLNAETSRRALLAFGNALASVGSGRADLDETIRQFGQLATASTLTAENLKPIIERVPQAAQILRNAFGTANAEELRKLGVTSAQVTQTLIAGLEQLPKVTGGIKNALENFSDNTRIALAEAGAAIAPFVEKALEGISRVVAELPKLAAGFRELPSAAQGAAVALAAVAFVGPLAIVAIGTIVSNLTAIAAGYAAVATSLGSLSAVAGVTAGALTGVGGILLAAGGAAFVLNQRTIEAAQAQVNLETRLRSVSQAERDFAAEVSKSAEEFAKGGAAAEVRNVKINVLRGTVRELTAEEVAKNRALAAGTAATKQAATATQDFARATGLLKNESFEARVILAQQNLVLAEQAKRIQDIAAARLALSRGVAIDFGDVPDISATVRVSDVVVPPSAELDELNRRIQSVDTTDAITRANQRQRIKETEATIKRLGQAYTQQGRVSSRAMREVSTVITNLSQGIGNAIFSGERFGAVMGRIARQIGASITSFIIQELIRATGLLEGFSRVLSGVIKNVAGGAAGSAAGAATSAAGSAAGGIGGAASGAASSAASGALGIVGAVTGVVSAISGVFGNFQMAGMNRTLDIIAKHTLETKNEVSNLRADEFTRKDELFTKLDDLFNLAYLKFDDLINSVRAIGRVPVAATGGGSVNNFALSAFVAPGGEAQFFDWFARELRRRNLIP